MSRSVYVVSSASGPVKIGVASHPRRRLAVLRTSSATKLDMPFSAATDGDARAIEARAHALLQARRLAGEWFDTSADDAVAAVIQAGRELGFTLTRNGDVVYGPPRAPSEHRTTTFQIRMRPSVKAAGEKIAAEDNRSLSTLMEALLIEHLRSRGIAA